MRALRDQYIDGGNLSQFQDLRAYSDWKYPGLLASLLGIFVGTF